MSTHNICFFFFFLRNMKDSIFRMKKVPYLLLCNIFLISPQKHMLWVLIRSALVRRF